VRPLTQIERDEVHRYLIRTYEPVFQRNAFVELYSAIQDALDDQYRMIANRRTQQIIDQRIEEATANWREQYRYVREFRDNTYSISAHFEGDKLVLTPTPELIRLMDGEAPVRVFVVPTGYPIPPDIYNQYMWNALQEMREKELT
jgi:hypothetical protein